MYPVNAYLKSKVQRAWTIEWGRQGKPLWVRNPLGVATTYRHDEHGRVLSIEDPMGRRVAATWTPHHEQASSTDGEGRATTFEHDGLGRVLGSRDAGGEKLQRR